MKHFMSLEHRFHSPQVKRWTRGMDRKPAANIFLYVKLERKFLIVNSI